MNCVVKLLKRVNALCCVFRPASFDYLFGYTVKYIFCLCILLCCCCFKRHRASYRLFIM